MAFGGSAGTVYPVVSEGSVHTASSQPGTVLPPLVSNIPSEYGPGAEEKPAAACSTIQFIVIFESCSNEPVPPGERAAAVRLYPVAHTVGILKLVTSRSEESASSDGIVYPVVSIGSVQYIGTQLVPKSSGHWTGGQAIQLPSRTISFDAQLKGHPPSPATQV